MKKNNNNLNTPKLLLLNIFETDAPDPTIFDRFLITLYLDSIYLRPFDI